MNSNAIYSYDRKEMKMKKLAALALIAIMILSLAACGKQEEQGEEDTPLFKREEGANIITGYKSGDVTLGQYTGLTYTPQSTEVTAEEIQEKLDQFVSSYKSKTLVTDRTTVQLGDVVDINYEGYKDGVAFEGGTGSRADLWIGSGTFISGFEEAIIGHEKGSTFEINVTFPENYSNKEMAGVPAVFKITLNELYYYKYPELTDDFVAEKTSCKTIEEYKNNIKAQITSEKEEEAEIAKQDELAKKVIANATFNIDLSDEMQRTLANLKNYNDSTYMNAYGVDGAGYYYLAYGMPSDQYETYLREMTEFSVKYEYIRSAIVEAERFEVTQEEMDTLAGNLMTQYGYTDLNSLYEKIKSQHGVEGSDFLREQVKLNKASDLIFSTAVPES